MSNDASLDLAEQIVYVVLMRILGVVGIVGNVLILFVLLRKTLNESSYVYLTAMTVFDVCVNVLAIGIGFIRCHKCHLNVHERYLGGIFEAFIFLPLMNVAATASLWTVLAMAVERFVFVAYPLKGKAYCRPRTARLVVLVICAVSMVVNVPRFFLYRVDVGADEPPGAIILAATAGPPPSLCRMLSVASGTGDTGTSGNGTGHHGGGQFGVIDSFQELCTNQNSSLRVRVRGHRLTNASRTADRFERIRNATFIRCCEAYAEADSGATIDGAGQQSGGGTADRPSLREASTLARAPPGYRSGWYEAPAVGCPISAEDYFLAVSVWEGLSFMALVYLNARLVLLLRRHGRERRGFVASFRNQTFSAIQAREELRLSVTLAAIIAFAVVTDAFTLLASEPVGHLLFGRSYKRESPYRVLLLVANLAVVSNSSFNFVVYAVFNSRFSQEFRKIYCSCFGRPRPETTVSTKQFARQGTHSSDAV